MRSYLVIFSNHCWGDLIFKFRTSGVAIFGWTSTASQSQPSLLNLKIFVQPKSAMIERIRAWQNHGTLPFQVGFWHEKCLPILYDFEKRLKAPLKKGSVRLAEYFCTEKWKLQVRESNENCSSCAVLAHVNTLDQCKKQAHSAELLTSDY